MALLSEHYGMMGSVEAHAPAEGEPAAGRVRLVVASAAGIFLLLLALNVAASFVGGDGVAGRVARLFIFGERAGFPRFFSFVLIVSIAALLARRAAGDRHAWLWLGLAAVFLLLGYDDAGRVLGDGLALGLTFAAAVVLASTLVQALPRAAGRAAILGAALFVCGRLIGSGETLPAATLVASMHMVGLILLGAGLLKLRPLTTRT